MIPLQMQTGGPPPGAKPLPWLPPWVILAAHMAHGLSWVLLVALAAQGKGPDAFAAFAWPHVAGLGWLTVLSLGVLCHVVPGFLDVVIPAERFARTMMLVVWAGALLLALGFWLERAALLPWGGAIALAGILGSAGPIAAGILKGPRAEPGTAPLVPAFLFVLIALLVAAVLGTYLAAVLGGTGLPLPFAMGEVAAGHAHWAAGGWLTLLVFGVSTRTLRRIIGAPPARWHGLASAVLSAGVVLLGLAWLVPFAWLPRAGAVLAAFGIMLYVADAVARLRVARGPHLPPRAYVAAGALYLAGATVLGLGTAFGQPWGAAYAFCAIAGWIGQTVNCHLLHIGTRFIATLARGDDDETPPEALLAPGLSWAAFALYQAAVVAGTAFALTGAAPWAAIAGSCGLGGWTAFSANALLAYRRGAAVD